MGSTEYQRSNSSGIPEGVEEEAFALNEGFKALNNAISFISWVVIDNPSVHKRQRLMAGKRVQELREAKDKMLGG